MTTMLLLYFLVYVQKYCDGRKKQVLTDFHLFSTPEHETVVQGQWKKRCHCKGRISWKGVRIWQFWHLYYFCTKSQGQLRTPTRMRRYCHVEKINLMILMDLHVFSPPKYKKAILCMYGWMDVHLASSWTVAWILIVFGIY
jgi:hypothetical protein